MLKGTRVLVDTLLGMHQGGRGFSEPQSDYPSLTQELLHAAAIYHAIYQAIHPRRGRPAKPVKPVEQAAVPGGWKLRSHKLIRPAHAPASA